ncbi:transcription initiation factor IIA subunit 1-like [Agrilus planipennis]|uniref:Transcription initiation factor IIA subunit 1-like n=1 Tax=Agrilus planipennis TaxID=224129 RepID=A0A1W4WG24_AGRPL|nr:transcription initiation factor IIA subunit 1-like [Agrilus planipennis]
MEEQVKNAPKINESDDYKAIIDNVLSQAEDLFTTEGVNKNVVEQLRKIWLSKFENVKPVQGQQQSSGCSLDGSLTHSFQNNLTLNQAVPLQLDGALDSSDDENGASSDDGVSEDNDEDKDPDDHDMDDGGPEEEPLGSEDDITDEEDPSDLFDTDNVIVCQYEKITRIRNKWKFHLKYGIMNLNGEDYVFQKADGDAEW